MPGEVITIIRLLHDNRTASVIIDGEPRERLNVRTGVKQGCVLGPSPLSLFLNAVLTLVNQQLPNGIHMRYRMDGGVFNLQL